MLTLRHRPPIIVLNTPFGVPMHIPSPKERVSAEEWQLRCDLAACYRLLATYGWSARVFTHVSAHISDPEHHFLIKPYGRMFDEITAVSIMKVATAGTGAADTSRLP